MSEMTRHQEIQQAVEKLLNAKGFWHMSVSNYSCFKCGQVQNRKAKGHPDIEVYCPNFYVEIKVSPDQLTPEQAEIKKQIEKAGNDYIIVRDNTDALIDYLEVLTVRNKVKMPKRKIRRKVIG